MDDSLPVQVPEKPSTPKKGRPWLAWLVIVGLVATVALRPILFPRAQDSEQTVATPERDWTFDLQLRYAVGGTAFLYATNPDPEPASRRKLLDSTPARTVSQRIKTAAAISALAGPEDGLLAVTNLRQLVAETGRQLSENESRALGLVETVVASHAKGVVPPLKGADRDFLTEELGDWLTTLLVLGRDADENAIKTCLEGPTRTFGLIILFIGVVAVGGMVGFIGLLLFLALWFSRGMPVRFPEGLSHHGVYAETFAVWMLMYFGLTLGISAISPIDDMLLNSAFAMFASLGAVFWPVLRGIPFSQVRQDIGWTTGRTPLLEPFFAIAGYLINLPIVGIGLVLTVLLLFLNNAGGEPSGDPFSAGSSPAHPIFSLFAGGSVSTYFKILLVASVGAPIMEETMFRGFLQRHLREATGSWPRLLGISLSIGLVSFIFAAVHPQGWAAIPLLASLAVGFSILREWRGSLIAPICAHAMNNATVMSLVYFAIT